MSLSNSRRRLGRRERSSTAEVAGFATHAASLRPVCQGEMAPRNDRSTSSRLCHPCILHESTHVAKPVPAMYPTKESAVGAWRRSLVFSSGVGKVSATDQSIRRHKRGKGCVERVLKMAMVRSATTLGGFVATADSLFHTLYYAPNYTLSCYREAARNGSPLFIYGQRPPPDFIPQISERNVWGHSSTAEITRLRL
jgi:hypothetical protein